MDIKDIFSEFSDRVTNINYSQREIRSASDDEIRRLCEIKGAQVHDASSEDLLSSLHAFYFCDIRDGMHKLLRQKESSISDRIKHAIERKNRKYQWLLVELYEAFEDYLEDAYALSGYLDVNFWPLRDYGDAFLVDIDKKDYSWFQDRVRQKRDKPYSLIKVFRSKFPQVSDFEVENKRNVDLRLMLVLIELLRHVIVHKGGVVQNRDEFMKKVLERTGLYKNGAAEEKNKAIIEMFFGVEEYGNTVRVLELLGDQIGSINRQISVFEFASDCLVSYAYMIFECLSAYEKRR